MTRKVYGPAEVATALGRADAKGRRLVSQWLKRGKTPPADDVLAMGPVWLAETIEPWIKAQARR